MHIWRVLFIVGMAVPAISGVERSHAADEITRLGEPRRNIERQARSVQIVAGETSRYNPDGSGVFPVMIYPSGGLVVEAVFTVTTASICKSVLAAYDRRLRAQHPGKIRHGLYCASIADGKVRSIDIVAKSF